MRLRALLALSVLSCSTAAVAGLKEGYEALSKKDYVAAANEYRPLAERGDPEAQYRIGRMYEFGNGYPQDKAQGIAWIRKAAAQGHADAEQELGLVYATGDGVKQDNVQAVAWFRKAAEQGDATAQYNLGLLYAKGQGERGTMRKQSTGGASPRPRAMPTRSSSWPSSTIPARGRPRMRSSHSPTPRSPRATATRRTSTTGTKSRRRSRRNKGVAPPRWPTPGRSARRCRGVLPRRVRRWAQRQRPPLRR
jgi:hypothetical protein